MIVAEFIYIAAMLIILYVTLRGMIYLIRTWEDNDANEDLQVVVFFSMFFLIPLSISMLGWFIIVKWGALIAESFVALMEMEM